MKILMLHNFYQQPGGEDTVFQLEKSMLRTHGHTVIEYTEHNNRIKTMNNTSIGICTLWSNYTYNKIIKILKAQKPDIAHFHNTFPLISPSAYYACHKAGVPLVQTLHNYRLLCPSGLFLKNEQICEDCISKTPPWPSILYGCYHSSRIHTLVVAAMITFHRYLRTWQKIVDVYIALSVFARKKFIEGGLPEEKILVKPNFVHPDPGERIGNGDYALFLGRLSPEKGIYKLINTWEKLNNIPLKIVGEGPLVNELIKAVKGMKSVEFLGKRKKSEVFNMIKGARFIIIPSICYENFPLIIPEAFACGVPVIGTNIGAIGEILEDKITGLHFNPDIPDDLAIKVKWAWEHKKELKEIGKNARKIFEGKYTSSVNYNKLMDIYCIAIGRGTT